jgi:hypothetical protein
MQRNALLNFFVRIALYLLGGYALWRAIDYTQRRGDDMVGVLLESGDGERDFNEDRLLALTVPVALLVLLAVVALATALIVQSRGVNDFEKGFQGISRLRREAQAGVSRTRPMTHILEEFISNARSAFRLQLWLSRTLFVVCLILLVAAVTDGILNGVSFGTTVLAGGSLISLLLGRLSATASAVGGHLGDATQLQLTVSSCARQVDVLEEYLYKVLEEAKTQPQQAQAVIVAGVDQVSDVTEKSVHLIQVYAEPEGDAGQQMEQVMVDGDGGDGNGTAPVSPAGETEN